MKKFFLVLLVLFVVKSTYSQSLQATADVGLWGGGSGYQGDMTQIDRLGSVGGAVGGFFRYNFNPRYAIRVSGMLGNVSGTGKFDDISWEFSKPVSDFSVVYEFNFWPYLIGSSKHNITTFLTLGFGVSTYADATQLSGAIINGVYTPPVPDGSNRASSVAAFNIPLGFGFKFNVTKRLGMGAEFVLRKYFDDRLDNLNDPRAYTIEETGEVVGYTTALHNNDWTFHLGVFVCYQIFRADKNCALYD
ncbi:MAG: DUF6089 family protein [Mangrovibacterium sp.]